MTANASTAHARTKMANIIATLTKASDAYYNGGPETMSDHEWDALFDELKKLEDETGIVLKDSPTSNVQKDSLGGEKVEHEYPALSLAKTKDVDDLVKWADGRPVDISMKLDGLTLVATYDNGLLTRLATRGDGHIGTDVTHLAPAIKGVPEKILDKGHVVLRGEAIISYKAFEEFKMRSGAGFANPRNLAAGTMALKDVHEVHERGIEWIVFTLVHTDKSIGSWKDRMEYAKRLGFNVVESRHVGNPAKAFVAQAVNEMSDLAANGFGYPVDGLVMAYDDTKYAERGTVTGHHETRGGLAFKWKDEEETTMLERIEWSCAASTITPVAVFEPVEIEGTTVRRASLCNISECKRLGIGGKGTVLSVIKANKIIPKVVGVLEKKGEFDYPSYCPVCGQPTRIERSISLAETLKCTNKECPAKKIKMYSRFVSKQAFDIDGLSEATLARFVDQGFIGGFADIMALGDHRDEIATLDGFGEKSADKLAEAVSKSSTITDSRLLYALSIPGVGRDAANRIMACMDFEEFCDLAMDGEYSEDVFAYIDGIGPETSKEITKWFRNEANVLELDTLLERICVVRSVPSHDEEDGKPLAGMQFVVTGKLNEFENRDKMIEAVESLGGKVSNGVSKSTSFLVTNDPGSKSSKAQKARTLGIEIISEQEFIRRFCK